MKQRIEQGQTLLDALVQYTGSIDSLFEFLRINDKQSLQFDPKGDILFPQIAKKSVVGQLQSAGAKPATADLQIYPVPTQWQPETVDFFNTIGIPNDETILYLGTNQQITGSLLWSILDSFVFQLKEDGIWKYLQAFYPFIGGTAKSHAVNLVKPGLFDINWNPAVKHSRYGVFFDGIGAYGRTNFYTSYFLKPSSVSVFYYNRNEMGSGIFSGSHDRLNPNGSVNILHDTKTVYTWVNSADYVGTPIKGQKGFFAHSRLDEKTITVFKSSPTEWVSKSYTSILASNLHFEEIYIGATNNNNVPQFFSAAHPSAFGFGAGLKAKQMDVLSGAITNFQQQLNRNV